MNKQEIVQAPSVTDEGSPFFPGDPEGQRDAHEFRKSRLALVVNSKGGVNNKILRGKGGRFVKKEADQEREHRLAVESAQADSRGDMDIRSLAYEARRQYELGDRTKLLNIEDEIQERIIKQAEQSGWDAEKTDEALNYFIARIYGKELAATPWIAAWRGQQDALASSTLGDSFGGDDNLMGTEEARSTEGEAYYSSTWPEYDGGIVPLVFDKKETGVLRSKFTRAAKNIGAIAARPFKPRRNWGDWGTAEATSTTREFIAGKRKRIVAALGLIAVSTAMFTTVEFSKDSNGNDTDSEPVAVATEPVAIEPTDNLSDAGSTATLSIAATETSAPAEPAATERAEAILATAPSPIEEPTETDVLATPSTATKTPGSTGSTIESSQPEADQSFMEASPENDDADSSSRNTQTGSPSEPHSRNAYARDDINRDGVVDDADMDILRGGDMQSVHDTSPEKIDPATAETVLPEAAVGSNDGFTDVLMQYRPDLDKRKAYELYRHLVHEVDAGSIFTGVAVYVMPNGDYGFSSVGAVKPATPEIYDIIMEWKAEK